MTPAAEDRVVELIYAAALDPALWPTAMSGVADCVGGASSGLSRLDVRNADADWIMARSDPAYLQLYKEYQSVNVFSIVAEPDVADYIRGWRPKVVTEADCLDWDDYQRSDFCNGYMRPRGVNAAMFIRLELDDTKVAALNIGRAIARGRFERHELEAAARLQPHLIRAYKFGRALAVTLGPERDLAQAMRASPQPIYLVDETGAIKLTNGAGERLLAAHRGLTMLGGRLVAQQSEAARRLEQMLGAATVADGVQVGGSMSVPSLGHRFPLALRVAPIPRASSPFFDAPRTALVCVTDLESEIRSPEDQLRALFGLTHAEARVATAIFDGLTMREASEMLGVALNTVRFQLARVYEKTGATRQAELVKLMMRLSSRPGEG